jgi:hypothetical protein
MNERIATKLIAASLAALMLAGCGGSQSQVASAPAPPIAPSPTTPPSPPGQVFPLQEAMQTTSPSLPVATAGATFSTVSPSTAFPLLLSATKYEGNELSGDPETTARGGTVRFDNTSGRAYLTVNNPAVGISDQVDNGRVNGVAVVTTPGQWPNLDYTRFGYWDVISGVYQIDSQAAWATGFLTPASGVPTNGTATYSGQTTLTLYSYAQGDGNVTLTSDFTARAVSGTFTGLKVADYDLFGLGPVNDVAFTAVFDPQANMFRGTTTALERPVAPAGQTTAFVLAPGTSGTIAGRFFGPVAQEVGGVWTLGDKGLGAFGARRSP